MSNDISGLNLKQPDKMDWDRFNPQSGYHAPPPAEGEDGKRIVYTGTLPKELQFEADQEGFLQVLADPITITGPQGAGYALRFARASVKPFEKNGKPLNVNGAGKLLRAAGSTARPQTNEEYVKALTAIAGKTVKFTIDWQAKNRDTGETIKGYKAFPIDPTRGTHQAILHEGDTFNTVDNKGVITGQGTVQSEVIFANGVLKSFVDVTKPSEAR